MTNVLIPSNFQNDTLNYIPELVETFPGMEMNVLLFHAFGLSSSITELLMLSRRSKEENLITQEFWRGCLQAEEEFEQINSVQMTFFYGTTMVAFKNFLKANKIDFIACPEEYAHQSIGKLSQDPILFINKCGLPMIPLAPMAPIHQNKMEWAS